MSTENKSNKPRLSPPIPIENPIQRKKPRLTCPENTEGPEDRELSVGNKVNVSINSDEKEEAKKGEVQFGSTNVVAGDNEDESSMKVDNSEIAEAELDGGANVVNNDVGDAVVDGNSYFDVEYDEEQEIFGLKEQGEFFDGYKLMLRVMAEHKFSVAEEFMGHMLENVPIAFQTLKSVFVPTVDFFPPHTSRSYSVRAAEVHQCVQKYLYPKDKKQGELNVDKLLESLFTISSFCSFLIGFCDCLAMNIFDVFRTAQLGGQKVDQNDQGSVMELVEIGCKFCLFLLCCNFLF